MHYFPIPLPSSIAQIDKDFWVIGHQLVAHLISGILATAELCVLAMWVPQFRGPDSDADNTARDHIRIGFILFGAAFTFLVLGFYLVAVLLAIVAVYILYCIGRGVKIVLSGH